jgi:proline dehydrogenase
MMVFALQFYPPIIEKGSNKPMMRQFFLYLSTAGWARNIVTNWGIARRMARRFVAGELMDEAIQATRDLNQRGILVTLDYLGESVTNSKEAEEVAKTYIELLDRIHKENLQSSVSLKLTHMGLDLSEELCVTNLRHVLTRAKQHNIPVTIDMESTHYTEKTIQIYRTMRDEYDFENVGTVIQAYLHRTEQDMHELTKENSHIRLCKGAYLEPPNLAFPEKADVDANYVKVLKQYLSTDSQSYLCIATHDEHMISAAEKFIGEQNIPQSRYEFQMLYGIRGERQTELSKNHKMRVYVPFGEAWYPYFVRRLAERPANVWFFIKSFVN